MTDTTKLADLLEMAMERRSSDAFGRTSIAWVSAVAQLIDENRVVVLAALRAATAAEPVAWRWWESKWNEYRYCESPNPYRDCEPLYAAINGPAKINADTDGREASATNEVRGPSGIGGGMSAPINGPAACSAPSPSPSTEGVGSASSGAAPIEGPWTIERLDKWIAYLASSFIGATSETTLPDGELLALLKAARAYQEAAAELAKMTDRYGSSLSDALRKSNEVNTLFDDAEELRAELARVKGERERSARLEEVCGYIRDAKRHDKTRFADDAEFADWAQSWARHVTQVDRAVLTTTAKEQT